MRSIFLLLIVLWMAACGPSPKDTNNQELPNILWITSEDNSPFLGCYGDEFATTPNLDKLASQGFLYTHAYANAPVCAPARNTIITGVYATSGGNQHMRSQYLKSDDIKVYPKFLRSLGYYCTNNRKTDYNYDLSQQDDIWDESSDTAHYSHRKEGQPFFAIFNTTISHESSIHKSIPSNELRHDPKKVPIPPYHPRTEDMEHDWAQYYDKVEDMDAWVGDKLKELDDLGLADNTIVFYYGDHGGVVARSKRYVYESGTRVPFIIRIPERYKNLFPNSETGTNVDRLISFVDLAPTLLSIVGMEIPDFMQGNAFLGEKTTPAPDYAYMFRGRMDERYDMSRAVRDQKFRYIKNYMPHRIYGQHLSYLWRAPSIRSWEKAYLAGETDSIQSVFWNAKPPEELYDTENDPWEVNNLANDPKYADVLARMRKANRNWMLRIKDTGFIPEPMRKEAMGDTAAYDYMREGNVPLASYIDAAELASNGDKKNIQQLVNYLQDQDEVIRYWGATGLLILGKEAMPALNELTKAAHDQSASVAVVAAEAIYGLGKKQLGEQVLLDHANGSEFVSTLALNAVDILDINTQKAKTTILDLQKSDQDGYNMRMVGVLVEKWGLDK